MNAVDEHILMWLAVSDLTPWAKCQRRLDTKRAQKIADDFDSDKFGIPVVMHRDAAWLIIDGQHRIAALHLLGWDDQRVQCQVYENISDEEAAKVFSGRNESVRIQPVPRFRAAVVMGDHDAVEIDRIVQAAGLAVSDSWAHAAVRAVGALHKVYRPNGTERPEILRQTLRVIRDAWGVGQDAMQGALIAGIGLFLARYEDVDMVVLRRKLAATPGGPHGLIANARTVQKMNGGSIPTAVAILTVTEYNKGRRTKQLPPYVQS